MDRERSLGGSAKLWSSKSVLDLNGFDVMLRHSRYVTYTNSILLSMSHTCHNGIM